MRSWLSRRDDNMSRTQVAALALIAVLGAPVTAPASGWITNPTTHHLYTLTNSPSSFIDARAEATSLGGYLVAIADSAEQAWLVEQFPGDYWIGLTDEVQEGTWVWDSGQPFLYANWCPGQPDNSTGCGGPNGEDYAHMHGEFCAFNQWNDAGNAPASCQLHLMR